LLIVDFPPHAFNIHINDVGYQMEMDIPDVLQQHRPGNYAPFMASQILEKQKLTRQQG
jgi:hypothetical protein